jgi:hypothetical protein
MVDDAVARVMRVVREREDATKVATRDAEKALARLARLDEDMGVQRAVLSGAVARVEQAGLLTVEQLAAALGVEPGRLSAGTAERNGKHSARRIQSGADATAVAGAAEGRDGEQHVKGASR